MTKPFSAIVMVLVFLLVAFDLSAQVTGRLSGSVVDPSKAMVPGAKVALTLSGGQAAVLEAETNNEGLFYISGIRPEYYDVTVEKAGFARTTLTMVKIDPVLETALPPIRLTVAAVAQTIDVMAEAPTVQTSNFEVGTIVTQAQVANLPLMDRDVSRLFLTQAGVSLGRGATVVDGMRTSLASVTLDGINIQDNFIRTNSLDFLPNRLTISQVSELSVSTSNPNASLGTGAAQVSLVTPSGTNKYHGEAYWYNRNSVFSANTWFNNKDGVERPAHNLNQIGGSLGGPIKKDKLFFYGNYEAYRYKAGTPVNMTVLTPDARQGIFHYLDEGGSLQTFNVLTSRGLQIPDRIQTELAQLPAVPNNSRLGDGLNNGGYSFNARDNTTRDNVTVKLDYNHSPTHVFSGSYVWNREIIARPDLGSFYTEVPPVYNDDKARLVSASWRWSPSARLTNELRGGFNFAPAAFKTRTQAPAFLLGTIYGPPYDSLLWDSPFNNFLPQGRDTKTYNFQDNATYLRGRHTINFGYQGQIVRINAYDNQGVVPVYGLGLGWGNTYGFDASEIPGVQLADLDTANTMLANLAGMVASYTQTFNVTSRTSGFVPGAENRRRYSFDMHSGYISDAWRIRPRLTLTLGLRYDYYTRVNERDALSLLPKTDGNYIQTLLNPDAVLDFAGSAVGRPYYNKDLNNLAPSVGFAWDVFGDGRTSVRGGYGIYYVNDETVAAMANNIVSTNSGLQGITSNYGMNEWLGSSPAIETPEFMVPRTSRDNWALDPANAVGMPDPNLRTPYVQEWNFGIEREVKGFVVQARYVGNHTVKGLRALDYNQVVIRENGFLADFLRARSNGFLALRATGDFNPDYDPSLPGSQPLPFFSTLDYGGYLENSTIRGYVQRGEAGALGELYQMYGFGTMFFRNPAALGANAMTNYTNSTYNALQIDVRRRVGDFQVQANYTYSKVLSDAAGDDQSRFEPFLDMNNPQLERARAPFDLTHVFKANYSVPLPFGPGKRFYYQPLACVLGGWSTSGFLTLQSGTPFSILSTRGTLNRGGRRSWWNTAVTSLNKTQLDGVVGFFQTGDGPYFINPSAIAADGRGVASDGDAAFAGQVFFNPDPGTVGALQRRMFNGPWNFAWDFGVRKDTKLTETQSLQFRADFYNGLNHPSFYAGDESSGPSGTQFDINSNTFGKFTETFSDRRRIQFGLFYKF